MLIGNKLTVDLKTSTGTNVLKWLQRQSMKIPIYVF